MVSIALSKSKLTLEYPYLNENLQVIANEHNALIMAGYTISIVLKSMQEVSA